VRDGQLEMVERSIERVRNGESRASSVEMWLSQRLVPESKIAEVEERDAKLQEEREEILARMASGELSEECGDVALHRNSYARQRLRTRGGMLGDGNDGEDYGEISEAVMHMREDAVIPGFQKIRECFRDLPENQQREVLRRCVENGKMTMKQANYWWTYYR